jgi:hypothetical protein
LAAKIFYAKITQEKAHLPRSASLWNFFAAPGELGVSGK